MDVGGLFIWLLFLMVLVFILMVVFFLKFLLGCFFLCWDGVGDDFLCCNIDEGFGMEVVVIDGCFVR